jgi:hypothetical protein
MISRPSSDDLGSLQLPDPPSIQPIRKRSISPAAISNARCSLPGSIRLVETPLTGFADEAEPDQSSVT